MNRWLQAVPGLLAVLLLIAPKAWERLSAERVSAPGGATPGHSLTPAVAGTDPEVFDAIVRFYRRHFPDEVFRDVFRPGCYLMDGPRGHRVHIPIPSRLYSHYRHDFAEAFLRQRLASDDAVTRYIASHLLEMKRPKLFERGGGELGGDQGNGVVCIDYVVDGGP